MYSVFVDHSKIFPERRFFTTEKHDLKYKNAMKIAQKALYNNKSELNKGVSVTIRTKDKLIFTASNP